MDKGERGAPGPRRAMYFLRRSRFLNCGTVQRISVRHLGKFYGDRMSVTLTIHAQLLAMRHIPHWANMTSTTKPEVHKNVLHRESPSHRHRYITCTENFAKCGHVTFWATVCKTVRPMID